MDHTRVLRLKCEYRMADSRRFAVCYGGCFGYVIFCICYLRLCCGHHAVWGYGVVRSPRFCVPFTVPGRIATALTQSHLGRCKLFPLKRSSVQFRCAPLCPTYPRPDKEHPWEHAFPIAPFFSICTFRCVRGYWVRLRLFWLG